MSDVDDKRATRGRQLRGGKHRAKESSAEDEDESEYPKRGTKRLRKNGSKSNSRGRSLRKRANGVSYKDMDESSSESAEE